MSLPTAFRVSRIARAALALVLSTAVASCATSNANHYRPALSAQENPTDDPPALGRP